MAQDIEKITQLLNEIEKKNTINANNFDKILSNISDKIDTSNKETTIELLRAYINELTNSVDEKYSNTLNRFEDIEKAIKAIYESILGNVKNSDMKELFEVLSKNINNFYTEARQEKAILSGIEAKISDFSSNKTDKEDILRTISLLRNDIGNINLSYKNTIDDINSTLKSILSGLKNVDPLKSGETTKMQIDIMFKSVNDILANLHEMDEKEKNLENIISNIATTEDLKFTNSIIDSIIQKTNEIEEKIGNNAQKEDIDSISQTIESLFQKTDDNATKEEVLELSQQTQELISETDEIKQALSNIVQNIEKIPDSEDLEANLKKLYSHIYDIADNIESANVKSDIKELNKNFETFKDELNLIKNIISDCNEAITSRVIEAIESNTYAEDVIKSLSDILKTFPKKSDIEKVLEDSLELNTIIERTESISQKVDSIPEELGILKNETKEIITTLENLAKTTDTLDISAGITKIEDELNSIKLCLEKVAENDNADIIEQISKLEHSASELLSQGEFNVFIEEFKSCISALNTNTNSCSNNIEEIQQLQKEIENKLDNLDFSEVTEILGKKVDIIEQRIDTLQNNFENIKDFTERILNKNNDIEKNIISISEFINNNTGLNNDYLKSELNEIKSIIEANTTNLDNSYDDKYSDIESIKKYLSDVKELLRGDFKGEVYSKLMELEDSLVNNQTFNESAFSQIIEKINNFKGITDKEGDEEQLKNTITEITSLKSQISKLINLFEQNNDEILDTPENIDIARIESFLNGKLTDLKEDLVKLLNTTENKVAEGFSYQADLLEQKTSALQKWLSEADLVNDINNPEFTEKISNTSETLEGIRQELQLISTDITENISNKTEEVLSELAPIKELLTQIAENSNPKLIKDKIEDINSELVSNPELSDLSFEFEELYSKLSDKFTDNENNLKDFVLTETDSLIIKFDNLKDYVEQAIESMLPPDENNMKELLSFVSEIKQFRTEQQELITQNFEDLKNNIELQNNEIKSLLEIAANHEDIINAIEKLKQSFKTAKKTGKSKRTDDSDGSETIVYDNDIIFDLKSDFEEYSKKIEQLSDNNIQISQILQDIREHLNQDSKEHIQAGSEIGDADLSDDISEDDIFGEDKFDFIQAFDILQNDIRNLSLNIAEIKNSKNNEDSKIPTLNNSNLLMNMNSKLDSVLKNLSDSWLKDIQEYIKSNNTDIKLKLSSIESKLDVFVSDTTNTDILSEMSETVNDIYTATEKIDKLTPKIEEKLSSMLEELNSKIAEISSNNNVNELNDIKALITEQKKYIDELEPNEKLEAFKKCLDEISFEVNTIASDSNADNEKLQKTIKDMKESLMGAVITIFDQVSFIEESEDIKDFVEERTDEINQRISEITKQLQQITSVEDNNNYTYTMQDIETDLAKLRLALQNNNNQLDLSDITEKLHAITSSVDSLSQDEIKDLKNEISALKEQTEFLVATSDKSYNVLHSGLEGFEEIIHQRVTDKVDNLSKMLETSAESDKVIKQSLIYIGEWIDSATESINKISVNTDNISTIDRNIKNYINEEVTGIIDTQIAKMHNELDDIIDEKFTQWHLELKVFEKNFSKVEKLEEQLEQQQEHIDRLEININKLLNIVENLEDPAISRKMDKIEKQISKLSTNIDKLASYVD